MKLGMISLGCAKNLVDTETMLGLLKEDGWEITPNPEEADILIVNTCAFIESAKEESITTVISMADYKDSGKCRGLILAGCLAERYGEELLKELPEVDVIVGVGAWQRIVEAVNLALQGKRAVMTSKTCASADANVASRSSVCTSASCASVGAKQSHHALPMGLASRRCADTSPSRASLYDANTPRVRTTPRWTTYVKIAEGCNHACAFCAIPLIRGKYRSRKIFDIVQEVQTLIKTGVKEINIIAQDTTNYGKDIYGEVSLAKLLKELVQIEGDFWIRVLYSYPKNFTDELIEVFKTEPKILKYVDLPLQHADNTILRAMGRPDTRESVHELLEKLRKEIQGISIRTTFLVGFPGETEEAFQNLCDFVREERFDKAGVFPFSKEEGTRAFNMEGEIAEVIKQERYHKLMSIQSKISEEKNEAVEGKIFDCLVEGLTEDEVGIGRSYREAPEVDGNVYIENAGDLKIGEIKKVKILQGFVYDVVGELID